MTPRISIALATYNGEKFLQRQLDSFSEQTTPPFELVVCDDGSSDGTVAILESFAQSANFPVRIHKNPKNLGFSNNFMKCAGLCVGEWIAFSDQDDVWLPSKLGKVSQAIEEEKSRDLVLVCHSADLVDEDLSPTGRRTPDVTKDRLVRRNHHFGFFCIGGFTTTFKAEMLAGVDSTLRPRDYFAPADMTQSHDKWIAMLANALGDVRYIRESLALYRRHPSAVSGSYAAQSPRERVTKSAGIGADYYQFQADAAMDCAISLRSIGSSVSDEVKRERMLASAEKYRALSLVFSSRAELYRLETPVERMKMVYAIATNSGYWGDRFRSLGTFSFLKDLRFSLSSSLKRS